MEILIALFAMSLVTILATNLSRSAKPMPVEATQADPNWPTPFSFI